jgi:hypothetical protein
MVPHSRLHFWLIIGLTALGFTLAVVGCIVRSSPAVALGFVALGVMQLVAMHSGLRTGEMHTNWGIETKDKTPIRYWFTFTLFSIAALAWTLVFLWLLVTGTDMFQFRR